LVAGGTDSIGLDGGLTSAELYDPGTNTWSSAGNMNASRAGAAAALLPGGEVLMVGGTGIGDDGPEVELYW
jgi:N-acetylneuraminic acid mutarotase